MKIFTDEFIEAREKFENYTTEAVYQWALQTGSDSMIEVRVLSIGDSNEFGDGFFVNPIRYELNIKEEIYSQNSNQEEISEKISKSVISQIEKKINKAVEESSTEIKSLKDVRKRIKVVIDGEFFIKDDLTINFAFNVQEYK